MEYFVDVIIPLSLDNIFTYQLEPQHYGVKPGMRLAVPFGKNKVYTAIAVAVHQNKPQLYQAKSIFEIIDKTPIVHELQLTFWKWMASYYMCAIGDVYKYALPKILILESETYVTRNTQIVVDTSVLDDDSFLIFQALEVKNNLKIEEISKIINRKNVLPIIQKMLDKNIILLNEEMAETYKPILQKYIRLHPDYQSENGLNLLLEKLKNAKKQKDIVLAFFQLKAQQKSDISQKEIATYADVSPNIVNALVEKEIFEAYHLVQDRTDFLMTDEKKSIVLSSYQQNALEQMKSVLQNQSVCLLHGVSSSGKTETYVKYILDQIQADEQVLILIPEIALTTQLVVRLRYFFGNELAVYHSKLNQNERVEVWFQVLEANPKARVVIGSRMALFLPFKNLKLVIVDEEHDANFKQSEPSPRFHARDCAIMLSHYSNAKTILSSATPSMESFYNVGNKKYGYVALTERFSGSPRPNIQLIDLKLAYKKKEVKGFFSNTLIEEISKTIEQGKQVILFQNRRGYSPVVECISCGYVPNCANCDVSLTYHKNKKQLRCHYCSYTIAMPTHCHVCNADTLDTKGLGTEQVEAEANLIFSETSIGRMDQDTTRGKFGFEKIMDRFQNKEIQILIGTQMVVKGLDFGNVGLVGVLNADNLLFFPDFRAVEKCYQILSQVAGRAGRSDFQGKVLIQTYNVENTTLRQVVDSDYLAMYNEQLYQRQIFHFSPYVKLIKITLKYKDFEILKDGAVWLFQILSQSLNMPVLGPEEPAINRIRNEFIRNIIIKIPNQNSLSTTKSIIKKAINSFESMAKYRGIKKIIDVDFN